MNGDVLILAGAIVTSVLGSTGMWAYIQKKSEKKSATTQLILGIAHMEIVKMGLRFIQRGWVSKDEYQDYVTYLVGPYEKHGGNGLADKIFQQVKGLPIRDVTPNDLGWTDEIPVLDNIL